MLKAYKNVLPFMASAMGPTNSTDELNEVKCRVTISMGIRYCLKSTISLDQLAHVSSGYLEHP